MTNLVFAVLLVVTNSYTNVISNLTEEKDGTVSVAKVKTVREEVTQLWTGSKRWLKKLKPKVHLANYDTRRELAILSESEIVMIRRKTDPTIRR